jgi:GDP-mannose 6-dehydrogenase
LDLELPLLESLVRSNLAHIERAIEFILATGKRNIGLLGLSFKQGSDDLRESPLLYTVKRLVGEGRQLRIYDPNVSYSLVHGANRQFAEREVPHIFSLMRGNITEIIEPSELIIIGHPDENYKAACADLNGRKMVVNISRLVHGQAGSTVMAA